MRIEILPFEDSPLFHHNLGIIAQSFSRLFFPLVTPGIVLEADYSPTSDTDF